MAPLPNYTKCIHSPPLGPVLRYSDPIHIFTTHLSQVRVNIISPPAPIHVADFASNAIKDICVQLLETDMKRSGRGLPQDIISTLSWKNRSKQ